MTGSACPCRTLLCIRCTKERRCPFYKYTTVTPDVLLMPLPKSFYVISILIPPYLICVLDQIPGYFYLSNKLANGYAICDPKSRMVSGLQIVQIHQFVLKRSVNVTCLSIYS